MPDYKADGIRRAAGLGVVLMAGGAAHAASVTVDFDQLSDGTPVAAPGAFFQTLPVRDEFAGFGVHFGVNGNSSASAGGGGVLSGSFGVGGFSGPNFLAFSPNPAAVFQSGQNPLGPEGFLFDKPANLVRLNVGGFGGTATLTAFDPSGAAVGSATQALGTTVAPLQVQSTSYNIAKVQLEFKNWWGAIADDLVFMVQDHANVPPVTHCTETGPAGKNGWFLGDVQATLEASDEDGTVASTQWRLDGGEWQPYSAPVLVSGNGTHHFEFHSVNNDGAWETVKAEEIKINTGKPVVDLRLSCWYLWPADGRLLPVRVNGSASDTGSGLAGVVFEVKDEYGEVQPGITAFGQVIKLKSSVKPKDWNGRFYQVTANATDNAGQKQSVTRWVLVPRRWEHC